MDHSYFFDWVIFQAGEAYFISDDSPVNNFEFFRPLVSQIFFKWIFKKNFFLMKKCCGY